MLLCSNTNFSNLGLKRLDLMSHSQWILRNSERKLIKIDERPWIKLYHWQDLNKTKIAMENIFQILKKTPIENIEHL